MDDFNYNLSQDVIINFVKLTGSSQINDYYYYDVSQMLFAIFLIWQSFCPHRVAWRFQVVQKTPNGSSANRSCLFLNISLTSLETWRRMTLTPIIWGKQAKPASIQPRLTLCIFCRDNFRPTQSLNDRKIYSRTEENVLPTLGLDERALTVLGTSVVSVGTFGLVQNLLSDFNIRRTFSENPLLEMIKRISVRIFKNLPFVDIF